jgi:hypothetical protein
MIFLLQSPKEVGLQALILIVNLIGFRDVWEISTAHLWVSVRVLGKPALHMTEPSNGLGPGWNKREERRR